LIFIIYLLFRYYLFSFGSSDLQTSTIVVRNTTADPTDLEVWLGSAVLFLTITMIFWVLVILLLVNMGLTAKVDGERLPSPISFTQVGNRFDPAVLVVCGTDGSGTRRVTEVLSELGAKMVYQDTATYDIHGKNRLMPNGWPEAVTPVLKQTHSLYYNVDDLPTGLKRTTLDRLSLLIDNTEVDNVCSLLVLSMSILACCAL
jgi:hypothetical protein